MEAMRIADRCGNLINKNALNFSTELAHSNPNEKSVKITPNAASDFSQMDADFIVQYTSKNSHILDLASGSGLILNKISPYVDKIVAVEPFLEFTQCIREPSKLSMKIYLHTQLPMLLI